MGISFADPLGGDEHTLFEWPEGQTLNPQGLFSNKFGGLASLNLWEVTNTHFLSGLKARH